MSSSVQLLNGSMVENDPNVSDVVRNVHLDRRSVFTNGVDACIASVLRSASNEQPLAPAAAAATHDWSSARGDGSVCTAATVADADDADEDTVQADIDPPPKLLPINDHRREFDQYRKRRKRLFADNRFSKFKKSTNGIDSLDSPKHSKLRNGIDHSKYGVDSSKFDSFNNSMDRLEHPQLKKVKNNTDRLGKRKNNTGQLYQSKVRKWKNNIDQFDPPKLKKWNNDIDRLDKSNLKKLGNNIDRSDHQQRLKERTPSIYAQVHKSIFSPERCQLIRKESGASKMIGKNRSLSGTSLCWHISMNEKLLPTLDALLKEELPPVVSTWSVDKVSEFIKALPSCPPWVADKFREEQVDGEAFLLLTQDDILNLMNIRLGPAVKIYNAIMLLKHKMLNQE